jgi:hypothetical protein
MRAARSDHALDLGQIRRVAVRRRRRWLGVATGWIMVVLPLAGCGGSFIVAHPVGIAAAIALYLLMPIGMWTVVVLERPAVRDEFSRIRPIDPDEEDFRDPP